MYGRAGETGGASRSRAVHGPPLENRQVEFGERKGKVDELVTQCYDHTSSLVKQLEGVMWSSRDAGHPASYTNTIRLGDPLSL